MIGFLHGDSMRQLEKLTHQFLRSLFSVLGFAKECEEFMRDFHFDFPANR
jgi:hypothetical protein